MLGAGFRTLLKPICIPGRCSGGAPESVCTKRIGRPARCPRAATLRQWCGAASRQGCHGVDEGARLSCRGPCHGAGAARGDGDVSRWLCRPVATGHKLGAVTVTPPPGPSERSANMRAIRRRDTRPELRLRSLLHRSGLRFRVDLPVRVDSYQRPIRPDVVFTAARVAVFWDGCFFHGCEDPACRYGPRPSIKNGDYWLPKIAAIARPSSGGTALPICLSICHSLLLKTKPSWKLWRRAASRTVIHLGFLGCTHSDKSRCIWARIVYAGLSGCRRRHFSGRAPFQISAGRLSAFAPGASSEIRRARRSWISLVWWLCRRQVSPAVAILYLLR